MRNCSCCRLLFLHLAELHRILRTNRPHRDGAAAVTVIQPGRRLGTHRKDEVELVFFRELDRFLALPILQIEVDDRELDLVLTRLEYLEYFGDRDVVSRRRPRIEYQHAAGRSAALRCFRPNREAHRIERIGDEVPTRVEVAAVAKPLAEWLLATQSRHGRRPDQQPRNDGAGQNVPERDSLDHSAGSVLTIRMRVEKFPSRKSTPRPAVTMPIQVRM